MGCFFIQNAWNCHIYKSWKQIRFSTIHFLLILGAFLVVYNVLSGFAWPIFPVRCLRVYLMPSLSLLSAGGVCVSQSSGRDVAFRPFGLECFCWIFFRCSSVLWSSALFSCHFRGANVSSVKSLGVWDSQHFGYQATDKERLENCLWFFRNTIILYGQMLVFCGFHFWTTAVKKLVFAFA